MDIIRAAIYARVSTKPQAKEDKISIEHQLRECKKFIEKERWLCVGEFVDGSGQWIEPHAGLDWR